jgi:hypothetical protein
MLTWRRGGRAGAVAAFVLAMAMALFQGIASAGPGPVDEVHGTVGDRADQLPSGESGSGGSQDAETVEEATATQSAELAEPEDDSPGHDTPQPTEPDHASGSIAEVSLVGEDLIEVGQTSAEIDEDGTSQGDVTVLAIGGQEVIGAHSASEGPESDSENPLGPLCEGSGGAVCLELLFADTNSTSSDTAAHSDAQTSLAFVCVGGTNPNPGNRCNGPVGAGVSNSNSTITRDRTTGGEVAHQETDVADVCLGGEAPITGTCQGLGVTALHSESTSTVDGDQNAETESSSYLAGVELAGQQFLIIADPTALALPPGCPPGASLLCVFLNQSAMTVSTGAAGSRQEALHVSVLAGVAQGADVALAHVGTAETFVQWTEPFRPPDGGDGGPGPGPDGGLAVTGVSLWTAVVVLALLMALGTAMLGVERRRRAVIA